jgi:hypothetical protein
VAIERRFGPAAAAAVSGGAIEYRSQYAATPYRLGTIGVLECNRFKLNDCTLVCL